VILSSPFFVYIPIDVVVFPISTVQMRGEFLFILKNISLVPLLFRFLLFFFVIFPLIFSLVLK